MAYNVQKTREWTLNTPNSGEFFNDEFNRIYENTNYLKDEVEANDADIAGNAANIASNLNAITSNDTDIANNVAGISNNASNISSLQTNLGRFIKDNNGNNLYLRTYILSESSSVHENGLIGFAAFIGFSPDSGTDAVNFQYEYSYSGGTINFIGPSGGTREASGTLYYLSTTPF